MAQQIGRVRAVRGVDRHANAGCDEAFLPDNGQRFAQRIQHATGGGKGFFLVIDFGQQHHKLVCPQTSDRFQVAV